MTDEGCSQDWQSLTADLSIYVRHEWKEELQKAVKKLTYAFVETQLIAYPLALAVTQFFPKGFSWATSRTHVLEQLAEWLHDKLQGFPQHLQQHNLGPPHQDLAYKLADKGNFRGRLKKSYGTFIEEILSRSGAFELGYENGQLTTINVLTKQDHQKVMEYSQKGSAAISHKPSAASASTLTSSHQQLCISSMPTAQKQQVGMSLQKPLVGNSHQLQDINQGCRSVHRVFKGQDTVNLLYNRLGSKELPTGKQYNSLLPSQNCSQDYQVHQLQDQQAPYPGVAAGGHIPPSKQGLLFSYVNEIKRAHTGPQEHFLHTSYRTPDLPPYAAPSLQTARDFCNDSKGYCDNPLFHFTASTGFDHNQRAGHAPWPPHSAHTMGDGLDVYSQQIMQTPAERIPGHADTGASLPAPLRLQRHNPIFSSDASYSADELSSQLGVLSVSDGWRPPTPQKPAPPAMHTACVAPVHFELINTSTLQQSGFSFSAGVMHTAVELPGWTNPELRTTFPADTAAQPGPKPAAPSPRQQGHARPAGNGAGHAKPLNSKQLSHIGPALDLDAIRNRVEFPSKSDGRIITLDEGKLLGRGSFGYVYAGWQHAPTQMPVAIKVCTGGWGAVQHESVMLYLVRDTEDTEKVHLVLFFQEGIYRLYPCFVFELCDTDMFSFLRAQYPNGMPESMALAYFKQMLQGMVVLECRNILHGDLKTSNLLLTPLRALKVSDLNCAVRLDPSNPVYQGTVGTLAYMAPEVFLVCKAQHEWQLGGTRGPRPADPVVTQKADVWSGGAILAELATGEVPQYKPHNQRRLGDFFQDGMMLRNNIDVWLARFNISQTIKDLIRRCMHKDAASRPSFDGMLQEPWAQQL